MPAYLLLIDDASTTVSDDDARIREWMARGIAAGVVRAGGTLKPPRLRVVREGGVTVAVRCPATRAGPHRAVLFEAEDEPSAIAWAAGCPGEGALGLYGVDDAAGPDWQVLRE